MRISTEALPKDVDVAVDWISGLIGAAVDQRVAGFEQQERTNPLLSSHFRENFALGIRLGQGAKNYRKGHRARSKRRGVSRTLWEVRPYTAC